MGPQPLPWGSSSTMKMVFLQSLQRPKWAASQVALSFSTRGLSTAQWSVTTAASMADMPTRITTDVILTLVACSSNMLRAKLRGCVCVCVCACVRARACGLHTCDGSWRRCRTPEVAFVLFAFGPLALDVNSRGSPPSCLRLRYTSDVLASLAHSCPQLLLSLSLPCAWWLVKRGQITVP